MHTKLLIDEIVRQTTVLIAQVSTAAGVRAPLASLADQVFLELSRELEAQGVRRTVVADMFGLALRSYQLKVQRVSETSRPETSLWESVHRELSGGVRTKIELQTALPSASSSDLTTVLNDLVGSGLAFSSGRGASAVFGLTSEKDLKRLTELEHHQGLTHWVWQLVATGRASGRDALAQQVSVDDQELSRAIEELVADGRVTEANGALAAESLDIPVGSEQGWEAAVSDHFRAVVTAIAAKLAVGRSQHGERVGGGTYRFTVHPEHPHEARVYGLLERLRKDLEGVWADVAEWNRQHPPPASAPKVTFYFGQHVTADTETAAEQHS